MKKHIINIILIAALIYAIFAFVNWEYNPSAWSMDARFGLSILWLALIAVYIIITLK